MDPVPNPPLLRKSGSSGNRTMDLWISSQEILRLDHRCGHTSHLYMEYIKEHESFQFFPILDIRSFIILTNIIHMIASETA
jgi:hypothetical protein